MPESIWSQDVFSKGELSPLMYARTTVNAYYNGLKVAQNVLTYPQGAAGKRFGTIYLNTIPAVSDYRQISFNTFQYLNECCYLVVIIPNTILVYLEGTLNATISTTSTLLTSAQIPQLNTTTIENHFRVCHSEFKPKDLLRAPNNTPNPIVSVDNTLVNLTNVVTPGLIVPIQFTAATIPTSTPQIVANKTYFARVINANAIEVFTTSEQARLRQDAYVFASAGASANVVLQNNWSFSDVVFQNIPVYDFSTSTSNYYDSSFTLGAVDGLGVTLTLTPAAGFVFTTDYVGGAFSGWGGISRIVGFTDSTHVTVDILQAFDEAGPLRGKDISLTQPAWSDTKGWPSKCSSFQSRSVFANSRSLPNGLWLSVINDYDNFDDISDDDDDSAISWYPSSDNVNYIRFIVPYRSLTIHTNTGVYSTPLSFETAVTPNTFSMTLQDSTPATAIQPRAIDNQIVVLSGNDVHSLLWDGFNNSYTSTIASVANEHLINNPHDEAAFVDLNRAGSRYMFIINNDGSMVIFQTLISENVSGFSPARLYQSYGNAYFRWAASSSEGRAWFLTERELATEQSPITITAFTSTTFAASGTGFSSTPTQCMFSASTMPATSPQIKSDTYYWAVAKAGNTFSIYTSQADALADESAITISSIGVNAQVIPWALISNFMIEELSFNVFVDCATVYSGTPVSTIPGQDRFNGQEIAMNGDGYGFTDNVKDGDVNFEAHGDPVLVSEAFIGFPIETIMIPMPVAPPGSMGYKGTSLPFPQHIRVAQLYFVDTVGGEVNDKPIAIDTLDEINPGPPPTPMTGFFQVTLMKGWNGSKNDALTITHNAPFDIKLAGIWYRIED